MANVDITSEQHATYGTASHGDETLAMRGGTVPAQLRWSDLHPPGVKVLPKGSPPDGPGEINWEDTLGGKFALALERLEGLLYAVFGSRPAAYNMSGQWRKCQWYDRANPRCLWGPEMWERRLLMGPLGCNETGTCWDYQESGKEYAAYGDNPPCCPMPKPSVPIRSRSGDPAYQYAKGVHDRTRFPRGSVERDFQDSPFDPEGFGWFGATRPGRNDAGSNPWLAAANGYTWKAGQAVKFYWTKPQSVQTPTSVTLFYQLKPPGGAWGGWQSTAMMLFSGKYQAQIAAQQHGTDCRWYIRYFWDDPTPGNPDVTKYDPGGDAAPAPENAYSFAWFSHFNPFANGLPEMLADYGGVDVRHGTDTYQFDGSEAVQPALIGMVRWVLSWLGGDCCTGEYETCAETDGRCDAFHHNPRFRGGDEGLCCVYMPIRFRWSGSNIHPYYLTGGKGEAGAGLDAKPLTNHPNEPSRGSEAARKSWRGINMLYADDLHFDNPFYGGGYSWGTAPGTFVLMYKPTFDPYAKVYAKYPSWGLRPGDVIEAVHIEEIIEAVNYLVDNGVWTSSQVCTRKRTPGSYMGTECGYHISTNTTFHGGEEWMVHCEKCCANADLCAGWWPQQQLNGWYHHWGDGGEYWEYWDPWALGTCETWPTPAWEDCWSDCRSDKCGMVASKWGDCWWIDQDSHGARHKLDVTCDNGTVGCGEHGNCIGCYRPDGMGGWEWYAGRRVCRRTVEGMSYFVCTPPACWAGWDASHGGPFKKNRLGHIWNGGLSMVATGPPGNEFSGNCLGDMYACGSTYPLGGGTGAWFHEVTGIYWRGMVADVWWGGCSGAPGCDGSTECGDGASAMALPPPIPGYGLYTVQGTPMCSQYDRARSPGGTACWMSSPGMPASTGHHCSCGLGDFPVCRGNAIWVAVDLNLDGTGRAYTNFRGRDGSLPTYDGRCVPRLRDYDMTKDPATWMHDCPCETRTGAGSCPG